MYQLKYVTVFFCVLLCFHPLRGFLQRQKLYRHKDGPCVATGVDILRESRELKKLKAVFNIETRKAYYRVKFCGHFAMCFAATIENRILDEDIVNDIGLWTKLIRTIQGQGHFMPFSKETHSEEYGSQSDYFNCSKGMYIITSKPSSQDIFNLTQTFQASCRKSMNSNARKKREKGTKTFPRPCMSQHICTRTCLHKSEQRLHCHEVRLMCNFGCLKGSKPTVSSMGRPCSRRTRLENKNYSRLEHKVKT